MTTVTAQALNSCGKNHGKERLKSRALSTLSQKSATVAENGETTATVTEFGDSRTFLRQCGLWTGFKASRRPQKTEIEGPDVTYSPRHQQYAPEPICFKGHDSVFVPIFFKVQLSQPCIITSHANVCNTVSVLVFTIYSYRIISLTVILSLEYY